MNERTEEPLNCSEQTAARFIAFVHEGVRLFSYKFHLLFLLFSKYFFMLFFCKLQSLLEITASALCAKPMMAWDSPHTPLHSQKSSIKTYE